VTAETTAPGARRISPNGRCAGQARPLLWPLRHGHQRHSHGITPLPSEHQSHAIPSFPRQSRITIEPMPKPMAILKAVRKRKRTILPAQGCGTRWNFVQLLVEKDQPELQFEEDRKKLFAQHPASPDFPAPATNLHAAQTPPKRRDTKKPDSPDDFSFPSTT